MDNYLTRLEGLVSKEELNTLSSKCVLIAGLGGVGSSTFIALLRSGLKKFIIIDYDKVEISNLNRQLLYSKGDLGRQKVEVAKEYALKIDEEIEVITINEKLGEENIGILNNYQIDFIVDAVDDFKAKKALTKYSQSKDIPFVMSLGMALKKDSTHVFITTLDKTTNDPLAKKMRYELKKDSISLSKVKVAFSSEEAIKRVGNLSSIIFVPVRAGFLIAEHVYFSLLKDK